MALLRFQPARLRAFLGNPRNSLLISALAIAIGAWGGCAQKKASRNVRVPVKVASTAEQPMPFVLTSIGTVEALRTASVGSQVGGVVTKISFREGDVVRAGQVLIQLDPRPFRAVLEQANAALARDRARAETARLDAERSKRLFEENVLSVAEWDQKRAEAEALAATVRADSATVATARLNLEYASIRAPISGRTGRLVVNAGDYVRAATSEPLVTIVEPHPIRVRFTIPERDVPLLQRHLRAGPRVEIRPGSAAPRGGKLIFVDNAVDPVSGTLLLKGEFANVDGSLVPGQFVDVRLILYVAERAIVIPAQAVSTGQQGTYVYIVGPDSTVAVRPVEIEHTQDELAVVRSGLEPGESVVTDGQLRLSPGARVVIRTSAAAPNGGTAEAPRTGTKPPTAGSGASAAPSRTGGAGAGGGASTAGSTR
jgi:membrane fusion protein, multidrug efflux system